MLYKILVIGLDESSRKFIVTIEQSMENVMCRMVSSFRRAIGLLDECSFDMVLGTLELLEVQGASLIQKISVCKNKPALLVFSSSYSSRTRLISAILAVRNRGFQFVGVISKPSDVADMRDAQVKARGLGAAVRIGELTQCKKDLAVLHDAFECIENKVLFKPRIRLIDGQVVAVEAVVCANCIASGLGQVLDKILIIQKVWKQKGYILTIWLKLPAHLLGCADYPNRLYDLLISRGGDPRYIGLDFLKCCQPGILITYAESIYQLGLLGFNLSHDDCGQGYSLYFKQDVRLFTDVKIFMSQIRSASGNEKLALALQRIVSECKQSGFTVVADGVMTKDELLLLQQIRCDEVQGAVISGFVDERGVLDLMIEGGEQYFLEPEN